jgi:asparagine synthase (glutamine-hydrolysing)
MMPAPLWQCAAAAARPLERFGLLPQRLPARLKEFAGADNTAIIQTLMTWVREAEHRKLWRDDGMLPIRRLFEPEWEHNRSKDSPRLEHLSSHATEVYTRLVLPNDFLFKVDTASMQESLEVRVPMLDDELFAFGLSLPHALKVTGRTCKRVLRAIARKWLPPAVANKPKHGFEIPLDQWVNPDFKACLRETLLGPSSKLPEFFRPGVYRPLVEAFCESRPCTGISRQGLYQRAIMLLSVHLALSRKVTASERVEAHMVANSTIHTARLRV